MLQHPPPPSPGEHVLSRLAYELLDAHDDTARIASEPTDELRWQAHLAYLRDLQRTARELLARVAGPDRAAWSASA